MTIEEKANAFSGMNEPHPLDLFTMAVITGLHDGFKAGAEWANKAIIDKACKWFDTYFMEIGYPDDWLRDSPNMESGKERFKKAMEE